MMLAAIFLIVTGFNTHTRKEKCKSPDLKAVKIQAPEWDHDNQQTVVTVIVKNAGKKPSKACRALLYDLDISIDQAKAMKLDKLYIEMIAENNGRASYWENNNTKSVDDNQFDYDQDFGVFVAIPELKPGEKAILTFYIKDIWVYDSNCELRLIVDIDETNADCDKNNNVLDFFGWG